MVADGVELCGDKQWAYHPNQVREIRCPVVVHSRPVGIEVLSQLAHGEGLKFSSKPKGNKAFEWIQTVLVSRFPI